MNIEYIEKTANDLLIDLWKDREEIWPNKNHSPYDVLDPKLASEKLGITFEEHQFLDDTFTQKGIRYKVAGLLDRQSNKIAISQDFSYEERRFTAAHELGHWILHKDRIIHRDRPVSNFDKNIKKPVIEKEADYFAACFLMPRKLLIDQIEKNFSMNIPIHINENIAYWLNPNDPESLIRPDKKSLDREIAIAKCNNFNSILIEPLTKLFKVSTIAMALRIKELKLIKWP